MTETVEILRIEATTGPRAGHGPYSAYPPYDSEAHCAARNEAMYLIDSSDADHPSPWDDEGLSDEAMEDGEFCGFESPRQLTAWFHSGSLDRLISTGFYRLYAYRVPYTAVRFGRCQVVFRKEEAVDRRPVRLAEIDASSDGPGGGLLPRTAPDTKEPA